MEKPNNSSFDDFYFEKSNLSVLENLKREDDLLYTVHAKLENRFYFSRFVIIFQSRTSHLYLPLKEMNSHGSRILDELEALI